MLPFGIGFSEVLLILVVVLLVVGPDKLPSIAKTVGKGVRAARRAGNELRDAVQAEEIRREVAESVRKWTDPETIDDVEIDEHGTYAAADLTSLGTPDGAESDKAADELAQAANRAVNRADVDAADDTHVAGADGADGADGEPGAALKNALTQARSPLLGGRPDEILDPEPHPEDVAQAKRSADEPQKTDDPDELS